MDNQQKYLLEKYCGIKYDLENCFQNVCTATGDHGTHSRKIETLKTWEFPPKKGDKPQWLPIGYYNFEVAKSILSKKGAYALDDVLEMCATRFWDKSMNRPKNICGELGFDNYNALMKSLHENT
jgi:hypothetical protein